jgi:protein involved in polysaccharide export with SLBB domain
MQPSLSVPAIAARLGVSVQALVRMATDHLVWVLDQVRDPGPYLVADHATLANMLQTAGGTLREADLSSVEVTSTQYDQASGNSKTQRTDYKGSPADFEKVSLQPSDVIRLRRVFSDRDEGRVTISGQVRYPGTFDITRGERLSDILERAGGLTDQAYAYGAVFTREQAALAERDGNAREARELEAQLATLASAATNTPDKDAVAYLGSVAQQLRTAPVLGRITITADPGILRIKPELDVILQPGDTLFIPKRPSTVAVSGEVLNNGSFQFQNGMRVQDYVQLAGGTTKGADDGRIFIVLPDGTAQPAEEHWLSFGAGNTVPPGSTIIVPRDLRPFDWSLFIRDTVQITSQLAVTAASLAVVSQQ